MHCAVTARARVLPRPTLAPRHRQVRMINMAFTAEAETGRSVEAASVEASPTAGPTLSLTFTLTLTLTPHPHPNPNLGAPSLQ